MTQPNNTEIVPLAMDAFKGPDDPTAALLVKTAQQAVLPRAIEDGIYAVLDATGAVQIVETPSQKERRKDEWAKQHAPTPAFIERTVTLLDAASFVSYLARHTEGEGEGVVGELCRHGAGLLEVWANLDARTIKANLDGIDGWRRHSATLKLAIAREWQEWAAIDGKLLGQVEFAEFIESHLSTIGEPAGAVLLDICQTLQAHTSVVFKQQSLLSNGQRQFRFEETTEAKAGQKGDLTIPGELTLVLRPFEGSDAVLVKARFRYQLRDGALRIGVKLAEPDRALEAAFSAVVSEVQDQVPVHVMRGIG